MKKLFAFALALLVFPLSRKITRPSRDGIIVPFAPGGGSDFIRALHGAAAHGCLRSR
jgi:tripartite-type tricarboxylate transporter receptor subunit TctC